MRLLAAFGWPWSREPILIAGAPRTGTSWTAKALSLGRSVRYLREPVSHRGDDNGELSASYRYLLAGDDDPEYAAVWQSAITEVTKSSKRWLLAETRPWLRRVPCWPARLLIKEVNCPLALEWLAEQFQMRIVVTIRHPCGYVASGLRVQEAGDRFVGLDQILSQPRLAAKYFSDDYDWLCQLDDPVARMAAGYGIIYRVLADQLAQHPEWFLVRHELFCQNPRVAFRRLFEALGISYSKRVDAHLTATTRATDGNLYSVCRNTSDEPGKWKQELSAEQIDTVASVIARFRLPFYRDFA